MNNHNKITLSIVSLSLVIFIDSLSWGLVYPLFAPLILNDSTGMLPLSISNEMRNFIYEFAIAIYCIFMFLFSPILGELSDKYGRKKILLLSMIGSAIGFLISMGGAALNSLLIILLGRIISGITAGCLSIAQAAMIDISKDHQKASRLSLIALANGLGFTCGPLIGGLIEQIHLPWINDNALVFLVGALCGMTGALFIKLFLHETFHSYSKSRIHFMTSIGNILNAFKLEKTRRYFACFLLSMLGYVMFFSSLPLFLHNKFNLPASTTGYFLSYFAIIFSASLIFFIPAIFKRYKIRPIVFTALIIQCIAYLLYSLLNNFVFLSFLVIPIAFVIPMMYVGIVTLISNNTSHLNQGKMMGVVGSVVAATWALGPLLTGMLSEISLTTALLTSAFFLLLSLFVLFIKNPLTASPPSHIKAEEI